MTAQKLHLRLPLLFSAEFMLPVITLVKTDHIFRVKFLNNIYHERQCGM